MTEQLMEQDAGAQADPIAVPIRVTWAPVVRVNLLPIEIVEARRFRRTQSVLAGAVLATVLVAAAGMLWAGSGVHAAEADLLIAKARVSQLQAEAAKYAAVPQIEAQVNAATMARSTAMSSDVLWYRYLNDLTNARTLGVELTTISASVSGAGPAGAGAPTAAGSDPLTAAGIGSISLEGNAGDYGQVAAWLEAVEKIPGLTSSTLTNATKSDLGKVTFSMTVVLDADALSLRYQKKAG